MAVYLRDNRTGETAKVGVFDGTCPGAENRMRLLPDGFFSLGIPALRQCAASDSEWVSIDEIGYLESGCPAYCEAVRELMERKRLIAVVRKQNTPFLQELCIREDVFLVDMDAPFGNLGCVIMASGMGKRFGGNKLLADFHGAPLIGRMLDATEGIFAHRVVVTRHEDVAALARERGIDVILHQYPYRSDTVRLGLETMAGKVDGCAFCPGDQPLLRWETAAALALCAVHDKQAIWRTACGETPGSPVLFPKWTFPELLRLPEGKGGSFVVKKYPGEVKNLPVRDGYELMDVDSPEDFIKLLEWDAAIAQRDWF